VEVSLQKTYGDVNFKGTNDRSQSIQLSGNKEAVSPMEAVLMSAAACSAVDVEILLKKMRQKLIHIEVKIKGERAESVPAIFTAIHMHYIIIGDIREEKAMKAIQLSMEKYCSVSIMLAKTAKISYTLEVRPSMT
jgi:putative redox protein